MKTLYLHVGTPKTGTTSIQTFCYVNIETLKRKGILYPIMPFRYPTKRPERNAMFLDGILYLPDGTRDYEGERQRQEEGFRVIREGFAEYDTILISEESLWMTATNRKKGLWKTLRKAGKKDGYQVKVIVYLRRQDEYMDSWWNQSIKANRPDYNVYGFEEFMEKQQHGSSDYRACIEAIVSELGKENLIVRRFDRNEFEDGSIQKDFLNAVGIGWSDDFELPSDMENMNTRLTGNTPEIKRVMNMIDMSYQESWFFRRAVESDSAISGKQYPAVFFAKEAAMQYMSRYEEGNEWIRKEFFDDGKPLFCPGFKEVALWQRDNPYLWEDIVRIMTIEDLGLLRRANDLSEQVKGLEKENAKKSKKIKELNQKLAESQKQIRRLDQRLEALAKQQQQLKDKLRHPFRTLIKMIIRRRS